MKKIFITVFTLWSTLSTSSHAIEVKLMARSIPDQCTYIYRIETDFIFEAKSESKPQDLMFYFVDIYTGDKGHEAIYSFSASETPGLWHAIFTSVTMSTAQHYLYHEMTFTLAHSPRAQTVNFSHLMNRCFPTGRLETRFQELWQGDI